MWPARKSVKEDRAPVALSSSGHSIALTPSSLYVTTQPSDYTEFSWALVLTDGAGNATRYAWSKRKSGSPFPSSNHMVLVPAGHKISTDTILPAQTVNIQPLDSPSSITNGRVNLAYFHVEGYFASFCIDLNGQPCFDAICHSVYPFSYITPKLNREAGITSQAWVMAVLSRLENMCCLMRGEGRLVMNLEQEILERSRAMEKGFDEDLRDHDTQVVEL